MGICEEEGNPIKLVFDTVQYGKHEINTFDGLRLKKVLNILSNRINISVSDFGNILYNYDNLDKKRTISQLGLPDGAVILVKFKEK